MRKLKKMSLQRVSQSVSLCVFLVLLWQAVFPADGFLVRILPADLFLRLDPLVFVGETLATREWLAKLWIALPLLLLTAVAGRVFCGYVCPMGTTLDACEWGAKQKRQKEYKTFLSVKYYMLAFVLVACALGVSLVFIAAPIPLVTRLYALLLYPVLDVLGNMGLEFFRPVASALNLKFLYYAEFTTSRYSTQLFLLFFFAVLIFFSRRVPRFWCRYICPSGALFALFSRKPLVRRTVSDACTGCGLCQITCPMNAIPVDAKSTRFQECVACETCVRNCPENAISFAFAKGDAALPRDPAPRRWFLWSAATGAGSAVLAMTGLHGQHVDKGEGRITPQFLIRPPGAIPEHEFLASCVRCGACMNACPTNTLQPIWFEAGFSAVFSPKIFPRRGPCDPLCTACGHACPTGAVSALSLEEKTQAKMGTAIILRHKCLAWEQDRECLVCDEVCPYDAIELKRVPGGRVPVPFVRENRCAGCGFCEHNCPVRPFRAVVVEPIDAVRLASGSYREEARARNLDISLRKKGNKKNKPGTSPYGVDQSSSGAWDGSGLPPGFSEAPDTSPSKMSGEPKK